MKTIDGKPKQATQTVATPSVSLGAAAGAMATSGVAVSAAGAGAAGLSGHLTGIAVLAPMYRAKHGQ
jgi:hypothetical protein